MRELCKEWQAVLRLQDWKINLQIARRVEMPTATSVASVAPTQELKYALILILDPLDYDTDGKRKTEHYQLDMEQALVHELIHIHLDLLTIKKREVVFLEQAIDQMAWALIDLKRRVKP